MIVHQIRCIFFGARGRCLVTLLVAYGIGFRISISCRLESVNITDTVVYCILVTGACGSRLEPVNILPVENVRVIIYVMHVYAVLLIDQATFDAVQYCDVTYLLSNFPKWTNFIHNYDIHP